MYSSTKPGQTDTLSGLYFPAWKDFNFVFLILLYLETCFERSTKRKLGGSHSVIGNIQMFCVVVQERVVKCYSFKTTTPEMHWTALSSETRRYFDDYEYKVRFAASNLTPFPSCFETRIGWLNISREVTYIRSHTLRVICKTLSHPSEERGQCKVDKTNKCEC